MATRGNRYFLPGDGIAREVVTADICRYLGNNALGRQGFWITAYRALTTDMIADLKTDSLRWRNEKEQAATPNSRGGNPGRSAKGSGVTGSPDIPSVSYSASKTHSDRQQYGPSEYQNSPQPQSARPHAPYEDSGRTGQAMDSQHAGGWDPQTQAQAQYYSQHNPHHQQGQGGVPPGYPPTGNYSATEGQYHFTTPGNTGTVSYTASETRPRDPGYPDFPAHTPNQQQQQQQQQQHNQPYAVDQRTGAPLYAQGSMQNPSSSMAPPGTRHASTRDHQYGRNDPYGGR